MMFKLLLIILSFITTSVAFSQYNLDEELSFIYVNGTSTLHDWTVSVNEMHAVLEADAENEKLNTVKKVSITIPVISLKSEKSRMDERMYKALKSNQFPKINYEASRFVAKGDQITAVGNMTIGGITRTVETLVSYLRIGKHLKFFGQFKLKMTDYNIVPPEFLSGAFKTGDEVGIKFYLMFCN